MDLTSLIGSILGGALGGSALAKFVIDTAKERWMESVKAQSAAELEKLKDELQSAQKALQARLDHGTYVTHAQYDLELSAYQKLWDALSDLREQWRSLQGTLSMQDIFAQSPDFSAELETLAKAVVASNSTAVLVSGRLAPFYEKGIQTAARATTYESTALIVKLNEWNQSKSVPEPDEGMRRFQTILDGVETIDGLIRDRLSSLRLV